MATLERLYTYDSVHIFAIVIGVLWFLSMMYFLFRRSSVALPAGTPLMFVNPLLSKTLAPLNRGRAGGEEGEQGSGF
jgi:hypothetical protein